ncbi:MAG: cyclic peptide export ABC transporter [Acaryochloridaceae cyanobacterium RU_4_10]|nr:cyclic peptide export ABC transporter [Acaryochloridaceae cyanobacterium RU_4_10]
MNLLHLLLSTSWLSVAFAVVAGLLGGICSAGLIALINFAIANPQSSNWMLLMGFIGLCLLLLGTMTYSLLILGRLVHGVTFRLRIQLIQRILACPLRHLEELGAPKLLAALTDDVEAISMASFLIANLCVAIAMLMACLLYLSWLSWELSGIILIYMSIAVWGYNTLLKRGRYFFRKARNAQDQLFGHFRTVIEGTKELKLHANRRVDFLSQDLEITADSVQKYNVTATDIFAFTGSLGLVLMFLPIGIAVIVAPLWGNLPTSVLSGAALTLIFSLTPLRIILNSMPELIKASVALEKIDSLGLSLSAQVADARTTSTLSSPKSEGVSFELINVTHTYKHERDSSFFTLGPIDLSFSPGELVFIVGGNGSGKSTLVKLITGLYAPENGAIRINSSTITNENRERYRQNFSVVFSDFYLFDRLLGLDRSDLDPQTQDYLIRLQLDRKVQVKDGVLSTTALSQGQRKRLALLTAYLEDRPIYVFDEWASDQDPVFKEIFYSQLLPELTNRGKTVLVVSHDDRYFDCADRIVKLDYGKIEYVKQLKV